MAVASANYLHLAPDRQPHQQLITQFLQAGWSSWRPTNSVKALKATRESRTLCKNYRGSVDPSDPLCGRLWFDIDQIRRGRRRGWRVPSTRIYQAESTSSGADRPPTGLVQEIDATAAHSPPDHPLVRRRRGKSARFVFIHRPLRI